MDRLRLGRIATRVLMMGIVIVVASCADPAPSPSGPHLRTFAWSDHVLCNAAAALPPVTGALEGDPADPELVWLHSDTGQRLSIVWPAGFVVQFDPGAVLYDDHGVVVARAGDTVKLPLVIFGSHAGTPEDPYFASGILFDGCYPTSR